MLHTQKFSPIPVSRQVSASVVRMRSISGLQINDISQKEKAKEKEKGAHFLLNLNIFNANVHNLVFIPNT